MSNQVFAPLARLAVVALVATLGLAAALGFNIRGFEHSEFYIGIATSLLCFGLYMAGYGIDIIEAKRHWRIVLVAITVGVVAKYAIIASIAYWVTGDWRYAVAGMAVAQIDPLSVAALNNDDRMSPRTKTVLNMWASYDDPVTALAAPILMAYFVSTHQVHLASDVDLRHSLLSLAPFMVAAIITAVAVLWRRTAIISLPSIAILRELGNEVRANKDEARSATALGAIVVAMNWRNAPLAALSSLFFRPKILGGKLGDLLTKTALYSATLMLGMILSGGVDIKGGLTIGFATYGSQIVVAWLVIWLSSGSQFSFREVWHLALAQQNGITAIVLALVLQPNMVIAVSSISLAIVVVNLLHFVCNLAFDKIVEPKCWPQPETQPAPHQSTEIPKALPAPTDLPSRGALHQEWRYTNQKPPFRSSWQPIIMMLQCTMTLHLHRKETIL
jgi:NhaP-type Na+/H+ or K+/H+ antiporter